MTTEQKYHLVYETVGEDEYHSDHVQFDTREELDDFVKDIEPCNIWVVVYGSDMTEEFGK